MKNPKSLIDSIFDVIHTQKELECLLLNLKQTNKMLAKTSGKRKIATIFKQLPSNFVIPIQEAWQNYQEINSITDPISFIKAIQKELLNLNSIQLFLAFQPSQAQAELICNWLRTKFKNKEIIIKIKFDPSLVAGCILEYQGKRYDLSISTQISNYVK